MIAAVVLFALAYRARRRNFPHRREMLSLMGLGVLGNGFYQIFFVKGISRTRKSGNAALIVAAAPAMIAITQPASVESIASASE